MNAIEWCDLCVHSGNSIDKESLMPLWLIIGVGSFNWRDPSFSREWLDPEWSNYLSVGDTGG